VDIKGFSGQRNRQEWYINGIFINNHKDHDNNNLYYYNNSNNINNISNNNSNNNNNETIESYKITESVDTTLSIKKANNKNKLFRINSEINENDFNDIDFLE